MSVDPQLLETGRSFHQNGQFSQAHDLYRQALAADPANADVLSLLGAVCINLNQWQEAANYLDEALRLDPNHYGALDNHGVLLARANRFAEAIVDFQRAAAINPRAVSTQLNLAAALARHGRADEAAAAFRRAVQLEPDMLRPHVELVGLFRSLGRADEALVHLGEIARLKPDDPRAHFEWALTLAQLGRIDEAMAQYRQTLRLDPNSAGAYVNLANLCSQKNQLDEAVGLFRRAIELNPNFAEAHANLATVLTRQRKLAEATAALDAAIRLKPDLAAAYNNRGIVLAEEGKFADAALSYGRAIELNPKDADAIYNLGIALFKQRMIASALEHFEYAIELKPDYAEAHHNRSAALLLSEDYAAGLPEYEWRFRSRDFPAARFRWPFWDGSPLAGRTIVLAAEQGLGDTIQFVRYAPLVQKLGARVIVECQRALHPILSRTAGVDAWITQNAERPEAEWCAPMLSLPYLLGTTATTIPADVPYVFADPKLVEAWRARLSEFDGLKIGIAWQGNPKCPGDEWRSIPLAAYEPLALTSGARLVNLQKGPGVEQLAAVAEGWSVIDFGAAVDTAAGAFMDTAAIMQSLDLVITSDTATAHLAGALGVPVWVALPYVPDWRWSLERGDCPWYPTMRLFRQTAWGQWSDVFERIAAAVETQGKESNR